MKWSDFFKKLGLNIDDEIDETSKEASKEISKSNKKEDVNSNKDIVVEDKTTEIKEEETDNKKVEDKTMAFKAPKRDNKGFFDLSEIEDADMKEYFKSLNNERKTELANRKAEDDKRVVSDAISKYASKIKFADGWGLEDALKLGDFSKVANDENMSKEIENAFTNLKSTKAPLFVADKGTRTTKSNPMSEGFNPVNAENNAAVTEDDLIAMAYGADE